MDKAKEMAKIAFRALDEKKGEDIRIIDISQVSTVADYFIIAGGSSTSQVKALCEYVDEGMSKLGVEVKRRDGETEGRWGVLDFGDCIVHIFNDETRLFYHLERLWGDESTIERITD